MSDTNLKLSIFDINKAHNLNTAAYKQIYLELGEYIGNQIIQASAANYGMAKIDLQEVNNITEQLNQMWIGEISKSPFLLEYDENVEAPSIDSPNNPEKMQLERNICNLEDNIKLNEVQILKIMADVVSDCKEFGDEDTGPTFGGEDLVWVQSFNPNVLINELNKAVDKHIGWIMQLPHKLFKHNISITKYIHNFTDDEAVSYQERYFDDIVESSLSRTNDYLRYFSVIDNNFINRSVLEELKRNVKSYYSRLLSLEEEIKNLKIKINSKLRDILSLKNKNIELNKSIQELNRELSKLNNSENKFSKYFYYPYYDIKTKEIEYTTTKADSQEEIIQWKMELDFIPKGVLLCWTEYAAENGMQKIKGTFSKIGLPSDFLNDSKYPGDFAGYKKYSFDQLDEKQLEELRNSIDKYKESLEAKV